MDSDSLAALGFRNDDRENLMQLDLLTALNAERAARRAAIVVTNVESGRSGW